MIMDLFLSTDCYKLSSVGRDSTARFWDAATLGFQSVIQLEKYTSPTATAQIVNSDRVAISHLNRTIEILDLQREDIVKRYCGTRVQSKPPPGNNAAKMGQQTKLPLKC